jgi:hypothetical protein
MPFGRGNWSGEYLLLEDTIGVKVGFDCCRMLLVLVKFGFVKIIMRYFDPYLKGNTERNTEREMHLND